MAKKEKLPGDIAKIIKTVGNTVVNVKMVKGCITSNTMVSRNQYNELMKCELIDVPTLQGFYHVDRKSGVAKLYLSCGIEQNLLFVEINGIQFKVTQPQKGIKYGK